MTADSLNSSGSQGPVRSNTPLGTGGAGPQETFGRDNRSHGESAVRPAAPAEASDAVAEKLERIRRRIAEGHYDSDELLEEALIIMKDRLAAENA